MYLSKLTLKNENQVWSSHHLPIIKNDAVDQAGPTYLDLLGF